MVPAMEDEVLRMRARLHIVEGKIGVVETLMTEFLKREDRTDRTFKWFVGIMVTLSPAVTGLIVKGSM